MIWSRHLAHDFGEIKALRGEAAPEKVGGRRQDTRRRPPASSRGVAVVRGDWLFPRTARRYAPYRTTVTARRFWLQQEMSLQIATGRSLPNDCEVIREEFTPRDTR